MTLEAYQNNPVLNRVQPTLLDLELHEQRNINSYFRRSIKKKIRKDNSKNFILIGTRFYFD